jgi:hypothetical protein
LDKDRLQVLVDAIERNPHLVPKAHRFFVFALFVPMRKPLLVVKENTFDLETGTKLVVDRRTPFNSLHFFLHPSFCLDYAQNVWKSKFRSLFLLVLEGPVAVQKLI